jgi:hypothetical protein
VSELKRVSILAGIALLVASSAMAQTESHPTSLPAQDAAPKQSATTPQADAQSLPPSILDEQRNADGDPRTVAHRTDRRPTEAYDGRERTRDVRRVRPFSLQPQHRRENAHADLQGNDTKRDERKLGPPTFTRTDCAGKERQKDQQSVVPSRFTTNGCQASSLPPRPAIPPSASSRCRRHPNAAKLTLPTANRMAANSSGPLGSISLPLRSFASGAAYMSGSRSTSSSYHRGSSVPAIASQLE